MIDEIVEFIVEGLLCLVSAIIEDKPLWQRILIWVAIFAVLFVIVFMVSKIISILKGFIIYE